jgi:hypothetical protein
MVYYSGGKAARYAQSICNRQNVCGGPKKAGIAPSVGWFMTSNPTLIGAPQSVPRVCVPNKTIQTQPYAYLRGRL